ncbi:MAG: dockerin type I repeat-containing protein, partial [Clostridia bacterium]|nr:dockerin type I repeat-containing protein [Clostridia bacterium]
MSKKPLSITVVLMCVLILFTCASVISAAESVTGADEAVSGIAEETVVPSEPDEPEEPACRITGVHVPGEWICGGDGTHSTVCALCGEPISQPCDYGSPAVFTPAGDGTHEKTCVVCGGKVSEPCVYGDPVTSLPTQTEPGMVRRACEVCGFEEVIETAAPEGTREASSLMGDVDQSGVVDTADARAVLRAAIAYSPLTAECVTRADLDEDGSVTASDARITLRISIGLDPERR